MRTRTGIVVLGLLAVGCGAPSVQELPVAAPVSSYGEARIVPVPAEPLSTLPQVVAPSEPPADPLDFFRSLSRECSRHASLFYRRSETAPPPIDEDRFAGAVLVRELDAHTALIEDGRGTRLVVDDWRGYGRVLPESGDAEDVMPEPYRSGCSPDLFLGQGG